MERLYEVSVTENISLVTLRAIPANLSFLERLFNDIAELGVNVDMISLLPPQGPVSSISFSIADGELGKVLSYLSECKARHAGLTPFVSSGNSKLCVCGQYMKKTPGVAARAFHAVEAAGADLMMVTTSEVDISMLVTATQADASFDALKREFENA